jgi:hypothetical protein
MRARTHLVRVLLDPDVRPVRGAYTWDEHVRAHACTPLMGRLARVPFDPDETRARPTGACGARTCAPTMMVGPIGEAFAPPRGVRAPYDGARTI